MEELRRKYRDCVECPCRLKSCTDVHLQCCMSCRIDRERMVEPFPIDNWSRINDR